MKETLKSSKTDSLDARLKSIKQWLLTIGYKDFSLEPASQDASFRRYFRMTLKGNKSLILMDAPPEKESLSPFIEIARDWIDSDIAVPTIYEYSRELGFLVLEDFGNITFLNHLTEENIDSKYCLAIDELIKIQMHATGATLPNYSPELLLFEMSLFIDWFVIKHCGYKILDSERHAVEKSFTVLMQSAIGQKQVTVHRDYHSRNLMVVDAKKLGVIDFQDAVHGPLCYDLVSLLKDCYIKLNNSQRTFLLNYYLQQATLNNLIEESSLKQFKQEFDMMGMQRHLKAIGIFCRLYHRDKKENYLPDIPLTASYIIELGDSYSVLKPITNVLEKCIPLMMKAN